MISGYFVNMSAYLLPMFTTSIKWIFVMRTFAGQRHVLVERYNQYKTAAIKAKQAGNDEVAVKYIRTAKVIVGSPRAFTAFDFYSNVIVIA